MSEFGHSHIVVLSLAMSKPTESKGGSHSTAGRCLDTHEYTCSTLTVSEFALSLNVGGCGIVGIKCRVGTSK